MKLPVRTGERPSTSTEGPHRQLSQNPSPERWGRLVATVFALPGVREGHSAVSLASSRAVLLELDAAAPDGALLGSNEPVHVHEVFDGSLHLCLPSELAAHAVEQGWAEPHGYADQDTELMVYGPRDDDELAIVQSLVEASIAFARSGSADSAVSR